MAYLCSKVVFWIQLYHIALNLSATHQRGSSQNSKGRAFMLSFLRNGDGSGHNGLIVVTDSETTFFVSVPATGTLSRHFLQPNSSVHIDLPYETTALAWGIPVHKAVSVYSTEPVSVYGITSHGNSSGGYMAIPVDKWGDHYIVATYDGFQTAGGEIVIIGGEDNTSVSVRLNVIRFTRCIVKERFVESTTLLAFVINREEVLRVACDDDLTGSVVKGSNPIGVITGNACAQVPADTPPCDHLVEMVIPTTQLGHEYIVATQPGRQARLKVIFTETEGTMNITMEYRGTGTKVVKTNRLYREFIIEPETVLKLNCSMPVLVVLFYEGTDDSDEAGGPSMSLVVPTERYDSNYNLAFNWKSLLASKGVRFGLNVFTRVDDELRSPYFDVSNSMMFADAFGYEIEWSQVQSGAFVSKDLFVQGSNIIITATGINTLVAFPAGMKLDLYSGVDNCTDDYCFNQGICYSYGKDLRCFCGDQLEGDRCENDIFNACVSSVCQNGGSCVDLPYLYECICPENFTGVMCELALESKMIITINPPPLEEICSCTCENVSTELIEKKKEDIQKDLTIDVKTTHRTKIKYHTTYDTRASSTGIGILGVVFLVLVFGGIILQDLITAVAHLTSYFKKLKWHKTESSLDEGGQTSACFQGSFLRPCISAHHCMKTRVPEDSRLFNAKVRRLDNGGKPMTRASLTMPESLAFNSLDHALSSKNSSLILSPPQSTELSLIEDFENISALLSENEVPYVNTQLAFNKSRWSPNLYPKDLTHPQSGNKDVPSCSRSRIFMPRFQVESNKVSVVGAHGETFNMRRPSWSLKKKIVH